MFNFTWEMVGWVLVSTVTCMVPLVILLWFLDRRERDTDAFIKKYWHL